MPSVAVNRDDLFKLLGKVYTDKEFDELCFEYGIELDEVTSEKEQIQKEQGDAKASGASDAIIYKIDIPANRYDLLCIEGIVQSLKVFLQQETAPVFECTLPHENKKQRVIIKQSTEMIRKYCVGAVLRNVDITQKVYNSFIDLQDKLHHNIGRKRTLVSIGTHDLDTIQGPFIYDAKPPEDIKFIALNQKKEYLATELMELYANDSHLKSFLPIIRESPVYPVIYDQNGIILSMPPIINGDHSKIKLSTKNIFIEITATDLRKANVALDTIVTMFSCYCAKPFAIEAVEVEYPDNSTSVTPQLPYRNEVVVSGDLNKKIGIEISAKETAELLTKMCLKSEVLDSEKGEICVTIPPTRSDVIHPCDIVEDVAIAYGFNNIPEALPRSATIGRQQLSMKMSERLRVELAAAGFTEALTFSLCSLADVGSKMRSEGCDMELKAVKISNPKTLEFQVVRTSLLPGLLKTAASNRKMPLPLKLFEIQEVALKDAARETGARNERRLAAVNYNKSPGFEILHGLLDRIMRVLEVNYTGSDDKQTGYHIRPCDDASFFPGRCAEIIVCGSSVGKVGVIHPEVVVNFDLACPVAALEINLEYFYQSS